MNTDLTGCVAKLDRARDLIQELDSRIKEFLESNTPELGHEINPATGRDELRFRKVVKPPVILSVIAGEVLYHLRSILDHLVYKLVGAETGDKGVNTKCEFPVFLDAESYAKSGRKKIEGMDEWASALVESLQPYHMAQPSAHPLAVLHDMNIIDKHRLLVVVVRHAHLRSMTLDGPDHQVTYGGGGFWGSVEEGTVLATLDAALGPQQQVTPEIRFDIAFAEIGKLGRPFPVIETLLECHTTVCAVIQFVQSKASDADD